MFWKRLGIFSSLALVYFWLSVIEAKKSFIVKKIIKEAETTDVIEANLTLHLLNDQEAQLNGEIRQMVDLNDDWQVKLTIFHANNPEDDYEIVIDVPITGVCSMMRTVYKTYFYDSLKNYANAPDPDICPYKKNNYLIKNYPFNFENLAQYLHSGYYRTVIVLLKNEMEHLKYVFESQIVESN